MANGRLYARNSTTNSEIVALDVAPPLPPVPALAVTAGRVIAGGLRLEVRAAEGGLLDGGFAQRLEIVSSADPTKPSSEWTIAAYPWVPRDGALTVEIPLLDQPAQFLRVREKVR